MSRILLAGESWVSTVVDWKGYDSFPHAQIHIGCERFVAALRGAGHEVEHLEAHRVAGEFPSTLEDLDRYDVVVLSDIGSNSLLLAPEVFERGQRFPNRLKLLDTWVRRGGALMMAGGYLSFQGFEGKANYHGTPLEATLPVDLHPYDDRVECPEGQPGELTGEPHAVTAGLDQTWPVILGYQRLLAKPDATVLATVEGHPLLVVRSVGEGRSLAFASDISPHWAPEEFMAWPGYARLFDQSVTWLTGS